MGEKVVPSCIARALHHSQWPFNDFYPPGNDDECKQLKGTNMAQESKDNKYLADGSTMGESGGSQQWCAMNNTLRMLNVVTIMLYGYPFKFMLPADIMYITFVD